MIATLLAVLAAVAPALAQEEVVPLSGGWSLHRRIGIVNAPEGVACSRDKAWVRNWHGSVAEWDGRAWTRLPEISSTRGAYGRTIAASPDGRVFMESNGGIAEWDGRAWTQQTLPSWVGDVDGQLAAPSAREVYYVGRGRIARRDATAGPGHWRTFGAGTWRELFGVAVVGPEIWVAGQGGTVLRHDGRTWTRMGTGVAFTLKKVIAFAANDVWVLGDGDTWRTSSVLHWNGTAWERREQGLPGKIEGLGGAADAVYATGEHGVSRWTATGWTTELAVAALGAGYHHPRDACATATHIIVADRSGDAIVRAR
jgi:hypothetical protein